MELLSTLARSLRRGVVLLLAAASVPSALPAETPVAPEYNVKAGFLVAFVQYTTWPATTFATPDAPVVIGIMGANPFGDVLARTAERQRLGRRIEVRQILSPEEALLCQVVFVGKPESKNEASWLAALKDHPILTVGESGQTLKHGGQLEFVIVNNRVRFDVSRVATESADLKISAPMLASARTVYQSGENLR